MLVCPKIYHSIFLGIVKASKAPLDILQGWQRADYCTNAFILWTKHCQGINFIHNVIDEVSVVVGNDWKPPEIVWALLERGCQ
jgi:hypothetical protein